MSLWRRKALDLLPSLHREIARATNPMALWVDIRHEFEWAYERQPPNEAVVAGFYRYARWCLLESRNVDAQTAASVAFYEHLPGHPLIRADLPRRIDPELFGEVRELFRYFLTEPDYAALLREYEAVHGRGHTGRAVRQAKS